VLGFAQLSQSFGVFVVVVVVVGTTFSMGYSVSPTSM
jgi:hypothetical protein